MSRTLPGTAQTATIIYAPSSGRAVHTETLRASGTSVCFAADCRYFHVSAFVACDSPDGSPGTLCAQARETSFRICSAPNTKLHRLPRGLNAPAAGMLPSPCMQCCSFQQSGATPLRTCAIHTHCHAPSSRSCHSETYPPHKRRDPGLPDYTSSSRHSHFAESSALPEHGRRRQA